MSFDHEKRSIKYQVTHRICIANRLEGLSRARSLVLVRMELQRHLPVRFLQLRLGGVLRHAQDLVVILASPYPNELFINGIVIPQNLSPSSIPFHSFDLLLSVFAGGGRGRLPVGSEVVRCSAS